MCKAYGGRLDSHSYTTLFVHTLEVERLLNDHPKCKGRAWFDIPHALFLLWQLLCELLKQCWGALDGLDDPRNKVGLGYVTKTFLCLCTSKCVSLSFCVCVCVCLSVWVCMCMWVCVWVCLCLCVSMFLCVCVSGWMLCLWVCPVFVFIRGCLCECYRFCLCCVSVYECLFVGVGVGRVTNNWYVKVAVVQPPHTLPCSLYWLNQVYSRETNKIRHESIERHQGALQDRLQIGWGEGDVVSVSNIAV